MVRSDMNIRKTFKEYKESSLNPVSEKEYVDINNSFMKFVSENMLEGHEVTLPAKVGVIFVGGTKRKNITDENGTVRLAPNWKATKELRAKSEKARLERQVVYCLNEHTEGVSYRITWSIARVPMQNKKIFKFRPTRLNKRSLHKKITVEKKEYIIVKET